MAYVNPTPKREDGKVIFLDVITLMSGKIINRQHLICAYFQDDVDILNRLNIHCGYLLRCNSEGVTYVKIELNVLN